MSVERRREWIELDHPDVVVGPSRQRGEEGLRALEPFANKAKSVKLLDPSVKSFIASLASPLHKNPKWMLVINEPVEIDF